MKVERRVEGQGEWEKEREGAGMSLPFARLSLRILLPPLIPDDPSTKSPIVLSLPSKLESRVFIYIHVCMHVCAPNV